MTAKKRTLKNACPECGDDMVLRNSQYGPFYGCINYPMCKATHSAHKDNGKPLGTPTDKETRMWRQKAHASFDRFWKKWGYKRCESYVLMQSMMQLPPDEAHIGLFDMEQCKKLIKLVEDNKPNGKI